MFGFLGCDFSKMGAAPGAGTVDQPAPAAPTLTLTTTASNPNPQFTGAPGAGETFAIGDTIRLVRSLNADLSSGTTTDDVIDAGQFAAQLAPFTIGPLADAHWYFGLYHLKSGRPISAVSNIVDVVIDATAPTLSSPTGTKTGITTATLTVSTNEANGTLFAVVVASADSAPTAAQIAAGRNAANGAAVYAGNQAVSSTGVKTFSATGLSGGTGYKAYFTHEDAVGNRSAVSGTTTFTTDSATAYVTGNRTASITVTNDTGTVDAGAITNLVNGGFANNSTDGIVWGLADVTNHWIKFDFLTSKLVQEAKWYQQDATTNGNFKWQGSTDNAAWTDIGSSFALGGATIQTQTSLNGNAASYRYYRLLGVSGSLSGAIWYQEVEFKQS